MKLHSYGANITSGILVTFKIPNNHLYNLENEIALVIDFIEVEEFCDMFNGVKSLSLRKLYEEHGGCWRILINDKIDWAYTFQLKKLI